MNFRIADTFTDSIARLTCDKQKAVKTTAFDLQLNLQTPGWFPSTTTCRNRYTWTLWPQIQKASFIMSTSRVLFLTPEKVSKDYMRQSCKMRTLK